MGISPEDRKSESPKEGIAMPGSATCHPELVEGCLCSPEDRKSESPEEGIAVPGPAPCHPELVDGCLCSPEDRKKGGCYFIILQSFVLQFHCSAVHPFPSSNHALFFFLKNINFRNGLAGHTPVTEVHEVRPEKSVESG